MTRLRAEDAEGLPAPEKQKTEIEKAEIISAFSICFRYGYFIFLPNIFLPAS